MHKNRYSIHWFTTPNRKKSTAGSEDLSKIGKNIYEPVGVAEKCNIICLCYPHHNNWGFVSLFPKKKISAKKNIVKKKHVKYKIFCNFVPDHH